MNKFKFLILLTLLVNVTIISYKEFLLKDNWQYSIDNSPVTWKKVNISKPIKEQGINLKIGETIYYKTSFGLNQINDYLPDSNNLGLYFGRIQGEIEIYLNDKIM